MNKLHMSTNIPTEVHFSRVFDAPKRLVIKAMTTPELVTQLAPLLRARQDLEPEDVTYLEDVIRATVRRARAQRKGDR